MFMHGYASHNMLISTIVQIPKNRKKSINNSDNYSYEKALQTSDMQFGFKEKNSTTQCTFSIQETIQYYQITLIVEDLYICYCWMPRRLLIEYNL